MTNSIKFQKRLAGELRDLAKNKMDTAQAVLDDNNNKLFYFVIRPQHPPYKGGMYMGKIVLPDDYPDNPVSFYMLTPSGRFFINQKICLTNSDYHKEQKTAAWTIRTMVEGLLSILVDDDATHGISHIRDSNENRLRMAMESHKFNIENYFDIYIKFDNFINPDGSIKSDDEINSVVNSKPKKKEKIKQEVIDVKQDVSEVSDVKQEVKKVSEVSDVKQDVSDVVDVKQEVREVSDVKQETNMLEESLNLKPLGKLMNKKKIIRKAKD